MAPKLKMLRILQVGLDIGLVSNNLKSQVFTLDSMFSQLSFHPEIMIFLRGTVLVTHCPIHMYPS